jgi:hypothetical protein
MGVLKVRKKKKSSGERVSGILDILLRSSSNRNIINWLEQYPPPCHVCGKQLTTIEGHKGHLLIHEPARALFPC